MSTPPPPPPADTIYQLKSKDGAIFPISEKALLMSTVLSAAIKQEITPTTEPIPVENIEEGPILKILIQWLEHHKNEPEFVEPPSGRVLYQMEVPNWDQELLNDDIVYKVSEAANYLEIKKLMVYCGRLIAMAGYNMNTEQLRTLYGY